MIPVTHNKIRDFVFPVIQPSRDAEKSMMTIQLFLDHNNGLDYAVIICMRELYNYVNDKINPVEHDVVALKNDRILYLLERIIRQEEKTIRDK